MTYYTNFYAVGDVDAALILPRGEILESPSGGEGLDLLAVGTI